MGKKKSLTPETVAHIIGLHKAGFQTKDIVSNVGVSERSVRNWVRSFKDGGGVELPSPKPRPGPSKKTSPRTLTVIKKQLEIKPTITARELKEKNPQLLSNISIRTVNRRVSDLGYTGHRQVKKPILSKKQKVRRLNFARKYLNWTSREWSGVLWSDEAIFTVTCNRGGHVYRRPGSDPLDPRYLCGTTKHPDYIMVWGCFTATGVGKLVVLPKNQHMNQNNYLELLCDELPDAFEKCKAEVFMQDGAPCHTAKSVKQWLSDCQVKYLDDWPGNSPDLNPIENLWQIVKQRLRSKDISSLSRLEAAVRDAWDNIPPEILRRLSDSLPNRLQTVINRKGATTKY